MCILPNEILEIILRQVLESVIGAPTSFKINIWPDNFQAIHEDLLPPEKRMTDVFNADLEHYWHETFSRDYLVRRWTSSIKDDEPPPPEIALLAHRHRGNKLADAYRRRVFETTYKPLVLPTFRKLVLGNGNISTMLLPTEYRGHDVRRAYEIVSTESFYATFYTDYFNAIYNDDKYDTTRYYHSFKLLYQEINGVFIERVIGKWRHLMMEQLPQTLEDALDGKVTPLCVPEDFPYPF